MRDDDLIKYPRTPHLEGSKLQEGDSAEGQIPYSALVGQYAVIEEKMDGANCGISFSNHADLRLQSRGHFLTGGVREKHFNLLKEWATVHADALFDLLGSEHVMYGEWMFAKHSVFYDELPHYFLEFDIYHKKEQKFYSTAKRQQMLQGLPIVSVPVLWQGTLDRNTRMEDLILPSVGRSEGWRDQLQHQTQRLNLNLDTVRQQTDPNEHSEGLYLKIEEGDWVTGRYKFIRPGFAQTILEQGEHWLTRPIVPNMLKPGQDIYADVLDTSWPAPRPQVKHGLRKRRAGWG